MDRAIAEDENVALLVASYVVITLHLAAQPGLAAELQGNIQMRGREGQRLQQQLHQGTQQRDQQQCHTPRVADAEMRAAGVGDSEPPDPRSPTLPEMLGLPTGRRNRRQDLWPSWPHLPCSWDLAAT